MTKFLDPKFSSRPASQAYRDNFDRTFNGSRTFKSADDGTTPAPEGQIWVCGADGRTSKTRYGFSDSSCASHAVLCYTTKNEQGHWVAVNLEESPNSLSDVVESTTVVQFTKPEHEACCNCRLCRTARRAEGNEAT